MGTIILAILFLFCLITALIQREAIKVLEEENSQLKGEKSKLSNSIREKGLLVDNLRKHNRKLLRQLEE